MISNKQLEEFWGRYQREGVPADLSMQAFCSMHNVPYNCFERYVRQRSKFSSIQQVKVTDMPETEKNVMPGASSTRQCATDMHPSNIESGKMADDTAVRILVSIKMSNGFQIHRSNIDYHTLQGLVEKMEVLC